MADLAADSGRFHTEARTARAQALLFLRDCVRGGLAHSYVTSSGDWVKPYPEVTGYLLSLFSRLGSDPILAEQMAERLIALQQPCGGYRSFYGNYAYVFDTAQICQGLLDWHRVTGNPAALLTCKKGAEFILRMQLDSGGFFPLFDEHAGERVSLGTTWGDSFSPINCKCAEFLVAMNEVGAGDYRSAVERICRWTTMRPQLEDTHPGAYSLEGLLAGGLVDVVTTRLRDHFLPRIDVRGFISYRSDLQYAYVSGSVQVGLLAARVGLFAPARRIWNWARTVQLNHPSGGLFQYANPDGTLNTDVHAEINSWGTKYYVELTDALAAADVAAAAPAAH